MPHKMSFLTYFILIFFTLSFFNNAICNENCKIRTSGTGTVLFNPTDVNKICWSQEEIAILTARIILEDIIPDPKLISVQCNEDVEDIVEYFKEVINTIRSKTKARKRHLMLMALTDLLGGFLHHAFLPMAKKAYYAGAVDYSYMEKVIQLYEELKWFLRTNGQGWTKAMIITKEVRVPLIEFEPQVDTNKSCSKVLFYEKEPIGLKIKRSAPEKGIYFPLPFFDAKIRPTAIALPLKHFALRNVESKRAAYIVMKYFILAEQCLKEKNVKQEIQDIFHNNLYTWIDKDVLPKLIDNNKFYAAFGGILRVQDTLKGLGAKFGNTPCSSDEGEEEVGAVPGVGCNSKRNKLLLIAMLVVILAWFLIGTCFICYRMKNNKQEPKSIPDEPIDEQSSSFSSSKWSSTKTPSLCKCCESTMTERSQDFTSTSEYDSEKSKSRKYFKRKTSKSSPCVCPNSPAIIDTKHSMKILPSIAEMSEKSLQKPQKKCSFRKISFADDVSSSEGVCAPPWAQSKKTIPCPALSDKSTNYTGSITAKSNQTSEVLINNDSLKFDNGKMEPLANSTTVNNDRSTPGKSNEQFSSPSDKKVSVSETVEEFPLENEARNEPKIQDPAQTYYNYHAQACHSSMSGDYDLFHRPDPSKPYIFGYDFQTTTSSELSDEDDI